MSKNIWVCGYTVAFGLKYWKSYKVRCRVGFLIWCLVIDGWERLFRWGLAADTVFVDFNELHCLLVLPFCSDSTRGGIVPLVLK
jgi:hypothetical protein